MDSVEGPRDPGTVLEGQEGSRLRGQRLWGCSKPFMSSEASRVTPHLISYCEDAGRAARAWSREGFGLFCLVFCMHIALWARSHGMGRCVLAVEQIVDQQIGFSARQLAVRRPQMAQQAFSGGCASFALTSVVSNIISLMLGVMAVQPADSP